MHVRLVSPRLKARRPIAVDRADARERNDGAPAQREVPSRFGSCGRRKARSWLAKSTPARSIRVFRSKKDRESSSRSSSRSTGCLRALLQVSNRSSKPARSGSSPTARSIARAARWSCTCFVLRWSRFDSGLGLHATRGRRVTAPSLYLGQAVRLRLVAPFPGSITAMHSAVNRGDASPILAWGAKCARSSAAEHLLDTQEIEGANPFARTMVRGLGRETARVLRLSTSHMAR